MLDIVILAAGKGTRMKSNIPKVLHTLGGQPLLYHVYQAAKPLLPNAIHVVIGHEGEQVIQALSLFAKDAQTVEQAEQLGTGHAVQQALPNIADDSTVLILCGDVPLIENQTLGRVLELVTEQQMGLLTIELEDPTGYGRIIRNTEGVTAIVEQKDACEEQQQIKEINTGIMAAKAHQLKRWLPALSNSNSQGEYYLTDIIAMAHSEGVTVATTEANSLTEITGINNRLQQAQLERAFQKQQAEKLMLEGVQLMDPDRFDCRGQITAGQDVSIDVNCIFEGEVTLGNQVTIGPNCIIRNTHIADGAAIHANSMLDEAHVGPGASVGPFARLRPGTQLGEQSRVGNFVETKKTIVGANSKINHLSYIGDTIMGDGVNIGAGTITCNYDGVNKFITTIENDAFVGSNSALVAPVTIGEGATVGAGSTITKSVEPETLSLTRTAQRTLKDWQRPSKK